MINRQGAGVPYVGPKGKLPRVNSFDAWDTLIARRSVIDIHNEVDNLFPIVENVRKVGPKDIIVSDFYDEKLLHTVIPQVTGLHNKVYITENGKREGWIWANIRKEFVVTNHTGDNPITDITSVQQAGIQATLTDVATLSSVEQFLISSGLPSIARLIREARLTTYDPAYRRFELLQTQVNFPILLLASYLLHYQVAHHASVLMSGRDCCLWVQVQERLRDMLGGHYAVHYFHTSRIARTAASPTYLAYANKMLAPGALVVDLCGYGRSLPLLLDKTSYPKTGIYLLAKYPDPGRTSRAKALTAGSAVLATDSLIERANLARHAMAVDVDARSMPVYSNPARIDWENLPEIEVSHRAFGVALNLLGHYNTIIEELGHIEQHAIHRALDFLFGQLLNYRDVLAFRNDIMATEEQPILDELQLLTTGRVKASTKVQPTKPTRITRFHCEMPYFGQIAPNDGMSKAVLVALQKDDQYTTAAVSAKMAEDFGVVSKGKCMYLPSFYQLNALSRRSVDQRVDNVACFGRIFSLKNTLIQAIASWRFAQSRGKKLRFHVNDFADGWEGQAIMQTLHTFFDGRPDAELVVQPWTHKPELYRLLATMTVGLQVSLSEAANVTALDMASVGIPIVVSREIKWAHPDSIAYPTDSADITAKMLLAVAQPKLIEENRCRIQQHNDTCINRWRQLLGNDGKVLFLYYTPPPGSETGISNVAQNDAAMLRSHGVVADAAPTDFSKANVQALMRGKPYTHIIFEASFAAATG